MDNIEKLKLMLDEHEKRIFELELLIKTKPITRTRTSKSIPVQVLNLILKQLNKLKLSELTLIALKFHETLTKEEIIKILKKWRRSGADSLRGGNFNRDLIRTGYIIEIGKMGKETVYELTEDGKIEADNIIKKLSQTSQNKGDHNIG